MKILLTGASSGIGQALHTILSHDHQVAAPTRHQLDLSTSVATNYINQPYDMLINCAGTGVGGKIKFNEHDSTLVNEILTVNFLNVVLLTQKVLQFNQQCKIVNITSTNNNRYWPNDLAYSLSKKCLAEFGAMLAVEYPNINYLEVRLGLTKTNFNQNRYKHHPHRFQDIYDINCYLLPTDVAAKVANVLFDDSIKFIEVSP